METGQHIGRYRLSDKIGKGGMAEIFKATEDLPEGGTRTVAIKRLFPKLSADREFVGMFVNEAMIASTMDHENIVRTYDLINYGSYYYIVMEYLEGIDLEELVILEAPKSSVLSLPEITYVTHEVAMGLQYAHSARADEGAGPVIHRDISPGNILIGCDGQVKITDFGIARAKQYASFTRPGVLKGKYEYMAPEYVKGREFDGRADIFSLGVVLYEMLTGENPFMGVTTKEIWDKILKYDPEPPSAIVPSIPKTMDMVVKRALAKDPKRRHKSGEEFAAVLNTFFADQGTEKVAFVLGERAKKAMIGDQEPETTQNDIAQFLPPDEDGGDQTREVYLDELLDLVEPVDVPQPRLGSTSDVPQARPGVTGADIVTAPKLAAVKLPAQEEKKRRLRPILLAIAVLVLGAGLAWLLWPGPTCRLSVDSDRRAEIFVDGERMGLAPIKELRLDAGFHVIEARRPGREQSKRYRKGIKEGEHLKLAVKWVTRKKGRRKRFTSRRKRKKRGAHVRGTKKGSKKKYKRRKRVNNRRKKKRKSKRKKR